MRFRLRTLLILMAIGPPVLAGAWYVLGLPDDAFPRGWWLVAIKLPVEAVIFGMVLWCMHVAKKPDSL
jgi:hypothetical protein